MIEGPVAAAAVGSVGLDDDHLGTLAMGRKFGVRQLAPVDVGCA
jgi:hypothetical protein